MPEWTPERVVEAEQAAALIGGQFPQLRDAHVSSFAEGWDNTVFLVHGTTPIGTHKASQIWAFRFPRRELALPGIAREIEWLPRLAPLLPLAVPVPQLVGKPSDQYPWPFWGAPLVPGVELPEAGLGDRDRAGLADEAGAFVAALHGADPDPVAKSDLPVDPLGRGDPARRVPMARERLERLIHHHCWRPDPDLERMLNAAESLGPPRAHDAVVISHGDLNLRHLLVAGAQATGVIDWGDLCVADPAVDLSFAYAAFDDHARRSFLARYGPVPADRELRARSLAAMLCAALADYAFTENRAPLLAESLAGLHRSYEGWPV